MSILEALRTKKCTRCLGCCYIALNIGYEIETKKGDNIPIEWCHVPIFDGEFEYVAMCNFASIKRGQPSCLIHNKKPKFCSEYVCWEDEELKEMNHIKRYELKDKREVE